MDNKPVFKRILLKVSGEGIGGKSGQGICPECLSLYAEQVREAYDMGTQIAMVVGGGNIFRGLSIKARGMERASADYMGMLATIINALALQEALEANGMPTRVMTAIEMREVAEPYIRRKAMNHLEKGRVVIFGGGTGNPFFTTDTAAALRAAEIGANAIFKATRVDGVYDSDPEKNPDAKKFDTLSFDEALARHLKIMDITAFAMCMENHIPIVVFKFPEKGNLKKALLGEQTGTIVRGE